MTNSWKYAYMPASERLEKIRSGDKDVFDKELERSFQVIKARKSVGLDIQDQKDWIDTLHFNYNIFHANRLGIDPVRVNRTGYAEKMLDAPKAPKPKTVVTLTSQTAALKNAAERLLDEYVDKVQELKKGMAVTKEWLLNNGIDTDSADGKAFIQKAEQKIDEQIRHFKSEYLTKLRKLG